LIKLLSAVKLAFFVMVTHGAGTEDLQRWIFHDRSMLLDNFTDFWTLAVSFALKLFTVLTGFVTKV